MKRSEAIRILGDGDLKKSFRRLVKVHHPDAGGDVQTFERIVEAYKVLQKSGWEFPGLFMRTETNFKNDLHAGMKNVGAFWFKCAGGGKFQMAGMPDVWVQHPIWNGWLELKHGKRKLEPLQLSMIKKIRERGGNAFCLRERDGVLTWELETVIFSVKDYNLKDGKEILRYCHAATIQDRPS